MKNKISIIISILLLNLIIVSCSNFFEGFNEPEISVYQPGEQNHPEITQKAKRIIEISGDIDVKGALPADVEDLLNGSSNQDNGENRTALPVMPSSAFYKVVAVNKDDPSNIVQDTSTAGTYKLSLEEGTWSVTAYIYNCTTAASANDATLILKSAAEEITLDSVTDHLTNHGIMTLPAAVGSGTAALLVGADGASEIRYIKAEWKIDGSVYKQYIPIAYGGGSSFFDFNSTSVPAGSYDVSFYFYKESLQSQIDTAVEIFSCTETVNVFNSLQTSKWQSSPGSAYISGTPAVFNVKEDCILIYSQNDFYVDSTVETEGRFATMYDPVKSIDSVIALADKYGKSDLNIHIKAGTVSEFNKQISARNYNFSSYGQEDTSDLQQNAVLKYTGNGQGMIFSTSGNHITLTNITIDANESSVTPVRMDTSSSDGTGKIEMNYCKILNSKAAQIVSIDKDTLEVNYSEILCGTTNSAIYAKDGNSNKKRIILNNSKLTGTSKKLYGIRVSGSSFSSTDSAFILTDTEISNFNYGIYYESSVTHSVSSSITGGKITSCNYGMSLYQNACLECVIDGTEISGNSTGISNSAKRAESSITYKDITVKNNTTAGIVETTHFKLSGNCVIDDSNGVPLEMKFTGGTFEPLIVTDDDITNEIKVKIGESYYSTSTQILSGVKVSSNNDYIKMDRVVWGVMSDGMLGVTVNTDIYVEDSAYGGDDTDGDGTITKPYATIKRAVADCIDNTLDWTIKLKSDLAYHSGDEYSSAYYVYMSYGETQNFFARTVTIQSDSAGTKRVIDLDNQYAGYGIYAENRVLAKAYKLILKDLQIKGAKKELLYLTGRSETNNAYMTAEVDNCLFGEEIESRATATDYSNKGTVISCSESDLVLTNSVIQHNYGTAINATRYSVVNIQTSEIKYNYSTSSIVTTTCNNFKISNVEITDNTIGASGNAGGIYCSSSTFLLGGPAIIKNNKKINSDSTETSANVVLRGSGSYIKIGGAGSDITGSEIYVTSSLANPDTETVITSSYSTVNSGTKPSVYFYSDDPEYKIAWNAAGKEGALVYKNGISDSISFVDEDLTFTINSLEAHGQSDTDFNFEVIKDAGTSDEQNLTSVITASDWTLKVFSEENEEISSDSHISITTTDSGVTVRRITVSEGIVPGTVLKLYVSVKYNGRTYGGSFNVTVVNP